MGKWTDEELASGAVTVRGHRVKERRDAFGAARRRAFLDVLAGTCCVDQAIEASMVSRTSVYRVRRNDPEFAADWQEALAMGHDLIEAKLMRYVMSEGGEAAHGETDGDGEDARGRADAVSVRPGDAGERRDGDAGEAGGKTGAETGDGADPSPGDTIATGGGAIAARDTPRAGSGLRPGNVPAWIQVALQLLNRHRASVEGRGGPMRRERMPTPAETNALLARRLDLLNRNMPNRARAAG